MTAREVVTVGVYGFTAQTFMAALLDADVGLVLDVRQRRGVRGSAYAWANAQRLQAALERAAIAYRHHGELAPTTELRQLQYAADDRRGEGKRSRTALDPEYVERYTREILAPVDLEPIAAQMPAERATALLCVERDPEACHRSLIAERMTAELGMAITDLRPPERGR